MTSTLYLFPSPFSKHKEGVLTYPDNEYNIMINTIRYDNYNDKKPHNTSLVPPNESTSDKHKHICGSAVQCSTIHTINTVA